MLFSSPLSMIVSSNWFSFMLFAMGYLK